jgi:aminoglycoside phosphotransferase (APT) family kinase protein
MPSGRDIVGETLRVLRADLEKRVVPNLTDPDACLAAKMIGDLLGYLEVWHLEGSLGDQAEEGRSIDGARVGAFQSELPVRGEARGRFSESLQDEIETLPEVNADLFGQSVASDLAFYDAENALLASSRVAAAERLARVEVEMTQVRSQALVDACRGPGITVDAVTRVPGGFSKDSFFLAATGPGGRDESMVIRRDLPFGPAETRIVDEYVLLKRLHRLGLAVAEPLGCDPTGIAGQSAMLSRRLRGASGTSPWDTDPQLRRQVCFALADQLATLHQLPPSEGGLHQVSSDPRDQLRAYMNEWYDRWRRNRVHASATLAAGFGWLARNVPSQIERVAIVHGDVGFHNAIVDDGRLSALLDWEFFHLGDPTEDLGYVRPVIEALIPWEEFLARYRDSGGVDYREENARYFELWRSVRNAVCCAVSWNGFLSGAYPALKMAYQGIPLYKTFVRNVAIGLQERTA